MGREHLTKGLSEMPYLATAEGRQLNADRCGDLASEYLSSMFSQPPAEFAEENAALVRCRLSTKLWRMPTAV